VPADRAVSKLAADSGPGDSSGIRSAVSRGSAVGWGSAVAPDEVTVDLDCVVEKDWVGVPGVGMVGEDRTCARVSTKEVRGMYGLPNRLETREAWPWC